MTNLRKAAQAVVERWDTPSWKDVPATAIYIEALRQALAQPEREWVDLTEEEIRSFDFVKIEYGYEHECWVDPKSLMKFAKNILQAAKEKNT